MTKDVIHVCLSRRNLQYCNIVMCYITCHYKFIYTGDVAIVSYTIIGIIIAGCGVVCNAAVVITMVTTYVCFRKRKKSGYNIGV